MDKVKVNIERNGISYFFVTANRRRVAICEFYRGGIDNDLWGFYPAFSGLDIRVRKSKEFPMEYFKRICQVVWFLKIGGEEFPEIQLTKSAMELVNKI